MTPRLRRSRISFVARLYGALRRAGRPGRVVSRGTTFAPQNRSHGAATYTPPLEALLADDPELALVLAPLHDPGTSCRFEACDSDEVCTCGGVNG
jgi:hypothetical protein